MNITWPDIFAGFMLMGLTLYAVTGGADFGGGVWDLLARGPRATAQRQLIDTAIAPVWEANHIWLIFVVVLLFTAFPPAFAAATIGLHLPLVLMLLGITLRGAAFVFRHYGAGQAAQRWGHVFAWASTITPILLGIILGAVTRGVHTSGGNLYANLDDWLNPFTLAVGVFTLALFAHVAAVFLAAEAQQPATHTDRGPHDAAVELQQDFRRRALLSGAAALVLGGLCVVAAMVSVGSQASDSASVSPLTRFGHRLLYSWWSWPVAALTASTTAATYWLLRTARWRAARWAAIAQVVGVVVGWGAAQYPILLAPGLTIHNAASPVITLQWVAPVVVGGSLILFPSLIWLMRTFKAEQRAAPGGPSASG